ncbi:MAG: polysaccharide pyruvyl transferase family protein [Ornithinimicrobium sp.]
MPSVYWWKPYRTVRALVGESTRHRGAWWQLTRRHLAFSNFGDQANQAVFTHLLERPVDWSRPGSADFFGIGSVLDVYARTGADGLILGSGLRSPDSDVARSIRTARVSWVRGHRTQELLSSDRPALGDPGLLVSALVTTRSPPSTVATVLPHFSEFGSRTSLARMQRLQADGVDLVTPNQSVASIAAAIASCRVLLTSSLHGIVFADALGVPVIPVRLDEQLREPTFKFSDYSSVLGTAGDVTWADPVALSTPGHLQELTDRAGERRDAIRPVVARLTAAMVDHVRTDPAVRRELLDD